MSTVRNEQGAESAQGTDPTFPDVYNAIGQRVWEIAGEAYSVGAHRDLVFGTSWQNVMEAVHQGFLDIWGCKCPPFREDPSEHRDDCLVYGSAALSENSSSPGTTNNAEEDA